MPFWLGDRGPIPCPLDSSRWKYDGDYNPVLIFFSFFSDRDSWFFYVGFKRDLVGGQLPCPLILLVFRSMGTSPRPQLVSIGFRWGLLALLLWRRCPLNFLWRTRPRPHPLTPRVVSSGGLLSGVAGLCCLVRGRRGAGFELNAREFRLWTRA